MLATTETKHARALDLTKRLVRLNSRSRTPEEREFADHLCGILQEIGGDILELGLHPVPLDPWERSVPWALLRGTGPRTVLLMSHYDTVDTTDYGALRPWATEPDELHERMRALATQFDDLTRQHLESPDEWLFGRGTADMKSGIAAHLTALEELCERTRGGEELPGNVLFICTPDEENESLGMLAAVQLLATLGQESGLEIIGAINTDYTTARYPGDEGKVVYTGTVGKLLPSIYVRGVETHAGEPYGGCDANLLAAEVLRALSMRADLADSDGEEVTPPPISLKAADFKDRYDVQIPFDAYLYVNFLTFTLSPQEVLDRVLEIAREAAQEALIRVQAQRHAWHERAGLQEVGPALPLRALSYVELLREAEEVSGAEVVRSRLESLNDSLFREQVDPRVRSVQMVRELWNLSGLRGPALVLYYSPPYYPHLSGSRRTSFLEAARRVARESGVEVRRLYPYMSDGSYLAIEQGDDLAALTENMPLWRTAPEASGYALPLDTIRALDVDVVDIGVWGYGAHKREERVHIPYSCGEVPRMVLDTILEALQPE